MTRGKIKVYIIDSIQFVQDIKPLMNDDQIERWDRVYNRLTLLLEEFENASSSKG